MTTYYYPEHQRGRQPISYHPPPVSATRSEPWTYVVPSSAPSNSVTFPSIPVPRSHHGGPSRSPSPSTPPNFRHARTSSVPYYPPHSYTTPSPAVHHATLTVPSRHGSHSPSHPPQQLTQHPHPHQHHHSHHTHHPHHGHHAHHMHQSHSADYAATLTVPTRHRSRSGSRSPPDHIRYTKSADYYVARSRSPTPTRTQTRKPKSSFRSSSRHRKHQRHKTVTFSATVTNIYSSYPLRVSYDTLHAEEPHRRVPSPPPPIRRRHSSGALHPEPPMTHAQVNMQVMTKTSHHSDLHHYDYDAQRRAASAAATQRAQYEAQKSKKEQEKELQRRREAEKAEQKRLSKAFPPGQAPSLPRVRSRTFSAPTKPGLHAGQVPSTLSYRDSRHPVPPPHPHYAHPPPSSGRDCIIM